MKGKGKLQLRREEIYEDEKRINTLESHIKSFSYSKNLYIYKHVYRYCM